MPFGPFRLRPFRRNITEKNETDLDADLDEKTGERDRGVSRSSGQIYRCCTRRRPQFQLQQVKRERVLYVESRSVSCSRAIYNEFRTSETAVSAAAKQDIESAQDVERPQCQLQLKSRQDRALDVPTTNNTNRSVCCSGYSLGEVTVSAATCVLFLVFCLSSIFAKSP